MEPTKEMKYAEDERKAYLADAHFDMKYLKNTPCEPSEDQIRIMVRKLTVGSHIGRIGL